MIDVSNPADVRREAERRATLRARGETTFGASDEPTAVAIRRQPRLVTWQSEAGMIAERNGDTLRLVLPGPPRTKKNGRGGAFMGLGGGPAYKRFRDRIEQLITPLANSLALPLPDVPMNITAVYYVDKPGERADLTGLHQGLFDALQDANVVSNDFWFRTADGSRIVFGDAKPRVDVTITRISA